MKYNEQHVIATIGPESGDIQSLKEAGMTMARLNMSHGTQSAHRGYAEMIQATHTPIIVDLAGPRNTTSQGSHAFDQNQEAITSKDLHDITFGVSLNASWFALSYVSHPEHILRLRREIRQTGGDQKVMAKIERKEALQNLEDIIDASDAILIGRGDLGNALGLAELPKATLHIVTACRKHQTPVIIGTEILESMRIQETPTRAEANDAWMHGYIGATGILLSAETAIGDHPKKAVQWASSLFTQGRNDRKQEPNLP